MKLFVKLQVPSIELVLKAVDAAQEKDTITVGFKRYDIAEVTKVLDEFQDIIDNVSDAKDTHALDSFIKSNVLYLKACNIQYVSDEEGAKPVKLTVPDTRTAKPVETLWDTPEECLDALLDHYLGSSPYRVPFINLMNKALVNRYIEDEGKEKN